MWHKCDVWLHDPKTVCSMMHEKWQIGTFELVYFPRNLYQQGTITNAISALNHKIDIIERKGIWQKSMKV